MKFSFELAGPADDAELRRVLRATPMPGRISLRLEREPSWFAAADVEGDFRQVVACREVATGRIIGFGCRSTRRVFVNGVETSIGYLSGLRVEPAFRNLGLIARGYRLFRTLHEDGRVPYYLTSIAHGNDRAQAMLTSGRALLPTYQPIGDFETIAIELPIRARRMAANVGVRPASERDVPAIVAFLNRVGRGRQFFPAYREADFDCTRGPLRGLRIDMILLAEKGGAIVGMMAAWDQHAFRQTIVDGYHGPLRSWRPVYNAWQRLIGGRSLPCPGEPLRCLIAALTLIAGDDPAIFSALLEETRRRGAGGSWSHLLVGMHEGDPLLPTVRRWAATTYRTALYLVAWSDAESAARSLDGRPIALELGSL